jgi:hypothetical protein
VGDIIAKVLHAGDDSAGGGAGGPLFELRPPRWPEALAHYYFAAAGNDSGARMALGYRHMHGLGVPKSCQAAVLYYQPVAEQVVDLARLPNALPMVGSPPCHCCPTFCAFANPRMHLHVCEGARLHGLAFLPFRTSS